MKEIPARAGWLLYSGDCRPLEKERPEIERLVASGGPHALRLRVVNPGSVEIAASANRVELFCGGEPLSPPDVVVPRMGTESCGRTLLIVEHLESLGVVCLNSPTAIRDTADKFRTMTKLGSAGIPIPTTVLPGASGETSAAMSVLSDASVLVKPLHGTQGEGIQLVERSRIAEGSDSKTSLQLPVAMVQEYIAASAGRAVRLLVFGDEILACYEKRAQRSFKANTATGAQVVPIPCAPSLATLARQVMSCLELDFAGVDFVFDGDHALVCDVNCSPSFAAAEAGLGINLADRITRAIASLVADRSAKVRQSYDLSEPLWGKGYVSRRIERLIRRSPAPPPPYLASGFFSIEETTRTAKRADALEFRPRSYQGGVDPRVRECFYAQLPADEWGPLQRFARQFLEPAVGHAIAPDFAAPPLIYRYTAGRGMVIHHDMVTEGKIARAERSNQPLVGGDYTAVWFLNSLAPDQGGELYFPETGEMVRSVAGNGVALRVDAPHGVQPLLRGERLVVVARFYCQAHVGFGRS